MFLIKWVILDLHVNMKILELNSVLILSFNVMHIIFHLMLLVDLKNIALMSFFKVIKYWLEKGSCISIWNFLLGLQSNLSLAELLNQPIINISKYTIIDPHEHFVDIIALLSSYCVYRIPTGLSGKPTRRNSGVFFVLFCFSGKGCMTGTSLEVLKTK